MSKGISLHIGMNRIDPSHYGTDGLLRGCINDAKAMREIAGAAGFETTLLTDQEGTSRRVLAWINDAARQVQSGHTVLITYAGHGSETPDLNNDETASKNDQTWCLYDRMVVDDELWELWQRFAAGVRIVFVSDSCHSASVARNLQLISAKVAAAGDLPDRSIAPLLGKTYGETEVVGYRTLEQEFEEHVNREHRSLYESIQANTVGTERAIVAATIVSLAACLDTQTAADGKDHGLFTQNLLAVWDSGRYRGGYRDFHDRIAARVRKQARQQPTYSRFGAENAAFEAS